MAVLLAGERSSKCTPRVKPEASGKASCQTPCGPKREGVKMALPRQCDRNTYDASARSPNTCEAGHVLSMSEQREAYELAISVPGVKQSDLQVSAGAGYLKVEGETSIGSTVYKIDRLFQFPIDSDLDLATAVHSDGVLSLTVPKVAKAQGKSIGITTAKDQEQAKTTASEAPRSDPVLSECKTDEANVQLPRRLSTTSRWWARVTKACRVGCPLQRAHPRSMRCTHQRKRRQRAWYRVSILQRTATPASVPLIGTSCSAISTRWGLKTARAMLLHCRSTRAPSSLQ